MDKFLKNLQISNYKIVRIDENMLDDVLSLCKKNIVYYEKYLQEPATLEDVKSIITELPPNTDKKQKYALGIYENSELIAILDIVLGYPEKQTAFIGLFMVDTQKQNKGVGTLIISNVLQAFKNLNFQKCSLGVITKNQPAIKFWQKHKFNLTAKISTHEKYDIVFMERNL